MGLVRGQKYIIIFHDGEKVARKEGFFQEHDESGIIVKVNGKSELISTSALIRMEVC